jgi:hypothetical protein
VLLAVVAVVVAAYAAVSVAFFVRPTLGSVAHPQAVVILQGYGTRDSRGLALARADHIGTVAVSWPPYTKCPASSPGLRVLCFRPRPVSTQGEAAAVGRLALAHGWDRLLVVAGTTQVVRAGVRLGRCTSARLEFSPVDPNGIGSWLYEIAYDQAALVKALVWQRSC